MRDLELAMNVAREAAAAGGHAALAHFRKDFRVERKPDNSPVTIADKESEKAIVARIEQSFPDDDILGEEGGAKKRGSQWRWIIDPLDGTRGFTRGGEFWGPLVALEHAGRVVAGAMSMPALDDAYWAAEGQGCWRNGEPVQVSQVSNWSEAVLSLGQLEAVLAAPHGPGVKKLIDTAFSARSYGDVAGCALVLQGVADAWIEAGVKIWDIAPYQILLTEAGGRFTDFEGNETIASGNAIGTNPQLHEYILNHLGYRA